MQAVQTDANSVLIRVDTNAGHGAGKPTNKQIDEATDSWSFVMEIRNENLRYFLMSVFLNKRSLFQDKLLLQQDS